LQVQQEHEGALRELGNKIERGQVSLLPFCPSRPLN
jgi:hypothetical protein